MSQLLYAYSDLLLPALARAKAGMFTVPVPYPQYVGREVEWCEEVLLRKHWAGQRAVIRATFDHRRVVVRGCRSASKTETATDVLLAFSYTAPGVAITTAPGARQVREQLWQRVASFIGEARAAGQRLPGTLTNLRLDFGPEHYALGFTTDDPTRFQGWHAGVIVPDDPDAQLTVDGIEKLAKDLKKSSTRRLLVIIDEAASVPAPVFDAIEGSLVRENTFILAFANPTIAVDSGHPYARAFDDGSGWHRIKFTALDPSEPDEVPFDECFKVPEWLLPQKWVEERRNQWTEESPLWDAYVAGRFPRMGSEYQFVPRRLLEACADLEIPDPGTIDARHIGVDVGAGGDDPSVATLTVADAVAARHEWRTSDTMATAGMVIQLMQAWGVGGVPVPASNVHVDATGVGKGVADRLKQTGRRIDAVDFGSAARYFDKDLTGQFLFANLKSELHWVMRRKLEEQQLCVPRKYREIWNQAGWPTFAFHEKAGGTEIEMGESKEELKKKHKRSPDDLDSLLLALARRRNAKPTFRVLRSTRQLHRG